MTDPTQVLLIIVVTVLTLLLGIIGVQVFFILREVQQSLKKVNKMLDDAGVISESIAAPIASLSKNLTGVSGLAGVFGWLTNRRKEREKKEEHV